MADRRFMTLHGHQVAYRDEGAGDETLLLVHGIAGGSHVWQPLMDDLSTSYRVIAPDLLGHGASDKPRADYSLGAFAVGLRDFLDELEVPSVTLVGHSLGGGIALQFVHQHRAYCRRLVLINSGGLGSDVGLLLRVLSAPGAELFLPIVGSESLARLVRRVRAQFARNGAAQDENEAADDESWVEALAWSTPGKRRAFLRTLRAVVDPRGQAVSALGKLNYADGLPALFIAGALDRIIPPAHATVAHEAVVGSRLHIIDDAGHEPHLECPDVVAASIRQFISEAP